ncbi:endogenous retrovirus group K member 24 Gag polyprotein-like [Talpa occidentalis]|uniref:endogenous retrovirus group K member 24 Gag polyprotein-like n=1 Tax=Talpa occidentalis TaxID=50954 RepID=UPI0023F6E34E|nr:endogenous retrovirus group K member 24 Gag polyprotein-like [Talpa occidentalis]
MTISNRSLSEFYEFILRICPWFPEEGSLSLTNWKKVGKEIRKFYNQNCSTQVPVQAFSLWVQIRDLLVDTTEADLWRGEISDESSEQETLPFANPARNYLGAAPSTPNEYEDMVAEQPQDPEYVEVGLEDNNSNIDEAINEFFRDMNIRSSLPSQTFPTAPPNSLQIVPQRPNVPPLSGGIFCAAREAREQGDFSFTFPVEYWEGQGPTWEPISLKTLKELKEAVRTTGPSSPYTLQVVDSLRVSYLIPFDWYQTAKSVLAPGTYVLWRTDYEDRAAELIRKSIFIKDMKPTLPMLKGTGEYANVREQLKIPKEILNEIGIMAVAAWKNLPPPAGSSTLLAGTRQRQEEPHENFVARLEEALDRMLPNTEAKEMLLKQLASENANSLCQELIRPIRKTDTIQDFIKACMDASPAVIQGLAYAAEMKEQQFSSFVRSMPKGKKTANAPICLIVNNLAT